MAFAHEKRRGVAETSAEQNSIVLRRCILSVDEEQEVSFLAATCSTLNECVKWRDGND
jgi:hypothetical protein